MGEHVAMLLFLQACLPSSAGSHAHMLILALHCSSICEVLLTLCCRRQGAPACSWGLCWASVVVSWSAPCLLWLVFLQWSFHPCCWSRRRQLLSSCPSSSAEHGPALCIAWQANPPTCCHITTF